MNEKQVFSTLEDLGWRRDKDEVGDSFCLRDIGCMQVQIIPAVGVRSDHFRVSFMPSVSTAGFTSAVAFILDEYRKYVPIIVSNNPPEKILNFSREEVVRLSEEALFWAARQDIEVGLSVYRALPTHSKGAMPLRHLAALAIARDENTLSSYKRSFERGDRLGFVPYITPEMIVRALLLAQSKE
jgi:hypothetical protein